MTKKEIEEKAKAYDEALKQIKECTPDENGFITIYPQEIFPELKEESEDEQIRKALITTVIHASTVYGATREEVLAWLKKQKEPKYLDTSTCEPWSDEQTRRNLINFLKSLGATEIPQASYNRYLSYLEKQGEYANFHNKIQIGDKPADKVEPKFKVGDWVVTKDGKVNQVKTVSDDGDAYDLDDDTYFSGSWKDMYHLWTIQDAKDGDVLATLDYILIFKKILSKDGGVSYCHYDFGSLTPQFNFNEDDNWYFGKEAIVHPATKEQRDTLFAKMKEAGYEWDAEKKELKKIENEIEIPFGAKDSELQEATYYIPKGFHAEIEGNNVVIKKGEQNPAWSEEDETMRTRCIGILGKCYMGELPTKVEEELNWLKSLKDRVQPQSKQEWSGGDEAHLHSLITHLEQWIESNPDTTGADIQGENIAWLKSLRPQKQCSIDGQELQKNLDTIFKAIDKAKEELRKGNNGAVLEALCIQYPGIPIQKQWKPSDEQMEVLSNAGNSYRPFEEGHKVLWSLYNDLKKLRE